MKDLKDVETDDIIGFSDTMEGIFKYIKKNWEGEIKPKGYDKFMEGYSDFDGIDEIDVKALNKEFKGYNDATAGSFGFHIKTTLPHVAYDDACQGRKPLEVLMGACLSHGMIIGEKRAQMKSEEAIKDFKNTIKSLIGILELNMKQ